MSTLRKVALGTAGVGAGVGTIILGKLFLKEDRHARMTEEHIEKVKKGLIKRPKDELRTRPQQLASLKSDQFDVLVIGGGATGSGCALDSVSRGLKTAMIELDDFASGTTSRSTKLIHGGVRYLQKAIMRLDYEQYCMVKEALHERANLLDIAPHLSFPLPIMLPVYKWWQVPYFWAGIKAYDLVSGDECLKPSYYLSKQRALELFPMLKRDKLKGAIVYYDGSHNDSRMCLSIAISAARMGATVANHTRALALIKDEQGQITGVRMRDELTGEEWETKAKCVVNATGPFTDSIRKMDNPGSKDICCPSMGVHIMLPDYYSPESMGLLDPATSDGRVIFFLPWLGVTIAGTTDTPCDVTHSPSPSESDIQFILNEVKNYLTPDIEVRRGDVLSAWSGIRPLVKDPNKEDTQSLVRNHVIHVSDSKLVTIAGGKWTTYRSMAQETLDAAVKACQLEPQRDSQTDGLILEGGHTWTPTQFIRLVQDVGFDSQVAQHLSETYGDRAFNVAKYATITGKRWPIVGNRLHDEYPYIAAEVRYAVIHEYAATAVDVVSKRLRLSFLNVQAAEEALPKIVDIMGQELNWSKAEKQKQIDQAINFLKAEMGKDVNKAIKDAIPISLSKQEISDYVKRFNALDYDKKGFVSVNDIRKWLKKSGTFSDDDRFFHILHEVDLARNGSATLPEFFQMMSAIKTGAVSHSRFAHMTDSMDDLTYGQKMERSGGGL
ncbi:glycerol-3-phosphate dehydrogenase, mitochondrial-like isoform X2 [Tigriopus californicus]|uniref:glycerol-3-phosphate dehydrogenase, mitochondrial-like isoform X2 n=1 Tax=Tigriopus californicus TaxID=6832 RepID=UPI0027D9FA26|nr:glycerol-3-phosphate dehydrogenase, mitochondrial-like isoform X2 [Tigriopus californicus]